MAAIRVHALLGLLALLAASARCWDGAAGLSSRQSLLDLVLAALEELERGGGGTRHSSSPLAFPSSEDLAGNAAEMSRIPSEIFFPIAIDTRDPSLKEKFIKHVTNKSSMYMSPECSRQFYRLYHNTRDCTVRSYYRRCARLLRRLTMSPLCTKKRVLSTHCWMRPTPCFAGLHEYLTILHHAGHCEIVFGELHPVTYSLATLATLATINLPGCTEACDRKPPTPAVNNPLPCNLRSEANKAAKILHEFTQISARNGPDKIIPAHVIAKANGLAILSVFKLGFLVTARGGSGIVIARLPGGGWSAPSAIGIAGLGGGFEIGVEVSDLVIILNTRRSVEAFTKGGNVTLGGNLTVAIGPLGRNAEADVALRSTSAVYTYCRSRGLFAGVSLEGSYLVERKDANRKFYCAELRASEILAGEVSPPKAAEPLYEQLENYLIEADQDMLHEATKISRKKSRRDVPPPPAPPSPPRPFPFHARLNPRTSKPFQRCAGTQTVLRKIRLAPQAWSWSRGADGDSQAAATAVVAVRPFRGQLPCDLSFGLGERIDVVTRTKSRDDWWEGRLHGRLGIFPATYVRDC
ncbi:unnamed protein product [Lampetra planeri]